MNTMCAEIMCAEIMCAEIMCAEIMCAEITQKSPKGAFHIPTDHTIPTETGTRYTCIRNKKIIKKGGIV